MLSTLIQNPRPHTVMEWLFAMLIFPVYEVCQRIGILDELGKSQGQPALIAERLALSERGVRCMLHALTAAGIVASGEDGYRQICTKIPEEFMRFKPAVEALLKVIDDRTLGHMDDNDILSDTVPYELTTLGITTMIGARQKLTVPGRRYFTPGQDGYLGGYLHYAAKLLKECMAYLPEVVRTGRPALRVEENPSFFAPLVEALFPINYDAARQMVAQLVSSINIERALDLGAGSAVWSIALAQQKPRVQIDALDLPAVLKLTRVFTHRYGVQHQYRFIAGDFMHEEHWGQGMYDSIFLCYLCCGFNADENQALFQTCMRHLRPGGALVMIDYLPKLDRTGPVLDVLFASFMLCVTEQGATYAATEYEAWCRNAGLNKFEWVSVPEASVPLLIVYKPPQEQAILKERTFLEERQSVAKTIPFVPPTQVIETTFAFAQSCMLLAAVETGVFTLIAHGVDTLEKLAQRAEVDLAALQRLLGGLHAMGFVRHVGTRYELTPVSERYLVTDRTTYIGDVALQVWQEWNAWIHLTSVIRTGQSMRAIDEEAQGGKFFAPLSKHSFSLIYSLMQQICTRLALGEDKRGTRVLDLGAGAAPGAIAVLERDAEAYAVAVDFAKVLEQAKSYAQEHGVYDRIMFSPTDLSVLKLPEKHFDLVLASHVFRIVGAQTTQRLIQRCYEALKPGGRLVVIETYKDPEHSLKLFPHIVAVDMLVNTRHGDAFRVQQMREWLCESGFQIEEWSDIGPDLILVATRV